MRLDSWRLRTIVGNDDQRVIRIEHFDDTPETVLKLGYEYNDRDLPTLLTESDEAGEFAEVTFTYDDRGRLIAEPRMASSGPSPEYDLAYEYDQAGNRTMKIDALNEIETSYVYDVDDGSVFRSDNNRLMLYETWGISGESSVLVSTTWTVYGDDAIEKEKGDESKLREEKGEGRRGWRQGNEATRGDFGFRISDLRSKEQVAKSDLLAEHRDASFLGSGRAQPGMVAVTVDKDCCYRTGSQGGQEKNRQVNVEAEAGYACP